MLTPNLTPNNNMFEDYKRLSGNTESLVENPLLPPTSVNPPIVEPPFDISSQSGIESRTQWINNHPDNVTQADKNWAKMAAEAGYQPSVLYPGESNNPLSSRFIDIQPLTGGTVSVLSSTWKKIQSKPPEERLSDLIKEGVYPRGTTLIADVDAYNKYWGTNHSKDEPYALPDEEKQVNKSVRDEGEARSKATKEIKEFENMLKTQPQELQDAYKKGGIDAYNRAIDSYNAKVSKINTDFEAWINKTDTPKDLQEAYARGKSSNDFTEFNKLTEKYNKEYREFIDKNIKADPYLSTVLAGTGGEKAAIDAYNKRQTDLQGIHERSEVKFLDWLNKDAPEKLKQAYNHGGKEEYDTAVKQYEADYNSALNTLEPYMSPVDKWKGIMHHESDKNSYDARRFMVEHPNGKSLNILANAGFSSETIDNARDYISEIQRVVNEINHNPKKWGEDFANNSTMQLQADKLDLLKRGVPGVLYPGESNHGILYTGPTIIGDFDVFWNGLSEDKKGQLVGAFNADPNRKNAFASLMERVNTTYDKLPSAAQFVITFIPYVGMPFTATKAIATTTAKKLTGQPVSGMEYAIDAAMAALSFLPAAGKIADKGITTILGKVARTEAGKYAGLVAGAAAEKGITAGIIGGSTAIFTKNLIDNWESMSLGERATNMAMLALPFTGSGIRKLQFFTTMMRDDYVPLRSMSREAETSRIKISDKQWKDLKNAGFTEKDVIDAGTEINTQLASGKKMAEVKLGPVTLTEKNVTIQVLKPHQLFQATPDITQAGRGGSIPINRDFYLAPKAAIEPMQRSYLTGQKATKPGINILLIDDPVLLKDIGPQERLIEGGKTLENEVVIKSRDILEGKGYRAVPVPGKAGRGVTFDESLGVVQIRYYTLEKVTGNEYGLRRTVLGGQGNGGLVVVPDIHNNSQFRRVFEKVNETFNEPIIKGNPEKPETWHYQESKMGQKRTVTQAGDMIDPGIETYKIWRDTWNRIHEEAKASGTGDRFERVLGNHESAILTRDQIAGYPHTDAERTVLEREILDDIRTGRLKLAISADGKLVTHAGVSKGLFPQYKGKTSEFIARDLNKRLLKAAEAGSYQGKEFATGRVEKGTAHSSITNTQKQGGPLWLRPQEASPKELDLGFQQIVGHNPGKGVRRIWGDNFIEADVNVKGGKDIEVYADTPHVKDVPEPITATTIPGTPPKFTPDIKAKLKLSAMSDTVADVFLGWHGRNYAIKSLVDSKVKIEAMLKNLDKKITERRDAGDSVGVRYLEMQKKELTTPDAKDYIYGGLGFWRDIAMGRQNSVKVIDDISAVRSVSDAKAANTASAYALSAAARSISSVRNRVSKMSSNDVQRVFNRNKNDVLANLDTRNINRNDPPQYRENIIRKASYLRDIVDFGLERNVQPYLDRDEIINEYMVRTSGYSREPERDGNYRATGLERIPSERTPERVIEGTRALNPREPEAPIARVPDITGRVPSGGAPPRLSPNYNHIPPRTPPPPAQPQPPKPPEETRAHGSGGKKKTWTPADIKAAVAFQMGQLKIHDKLEPVIIARKPPYRDIDSQVFVGEIPKGMKLSTDQASAYKTIQQLRGSQSPVEFTGKQGFAKYTVKNPSSIPGKPGAINFESDEIKQPKQQKKPAQNNKSPLVLNRFNKNGRNTAGGFFLSTGTQEFVTPHEPASTSIAPVPQPKMKRNIVPVPRKISSHPDVIEVSRFNADTLVRIDKAPVRPLAFANAQNVPEKLAQRIQKYAKDNQGVLYGSLNAYTKLENAPLPHDIDLAFKTRAKAEKDILKIASDEGYKVKPGFPHCVKILKDGKWQEIADIDSISHHKTLLPKGLSQQVLTKIDGINTETIGEQYLRQSYGAVSGSKKSSQRAEHVQRAASEVRKMLQLAGAQSRAPKPRRNREHFGDSTRRMAKRLSGNDFASMRNVSKRKSGVFRTSVQGGTLISGSPIRGR
jgi:hypothetical protein